MNPIAIALLLLPQAHDLSSGSTRDLKPGHRIAMAASHTGKYLVIGESERILVLEGDTLKTVTEIPCRWTGFGFDEDDRRLLVVGSEVISVDRSAWKPRALGA